MREINSYLDKFSNITPFESKVQTEVVRVIKSVVGYSIDPKYIKLNNKSIVVLVHPSVKKRIMDNKHEILFEINKKEDLEINSLI